MFRSPFVNVVRYSTTRNVGYLFTNQFRNFSKRRDNYEMTEEECSFYDYLLAKSQKNLNEKELYKIISKYKNLTESLRNAPHDLIYIETIKICQRNGETEIPFELFKQLKRYKTKPNQVIYLLMMKICIEIKQKGLAYSLLEELINQSITPKEELYTEIISLFVKEKHIDLIPELYLTLKEKNIKNKEILLGVVARELYKNQYFSQAEELLISEMRNKIGPISQFFEYFSGLFDELYKSNEYKKISELFLKLIKFGIRPDERMINIFIKSFTLTDSLPEAFELFFKTKLIPMELKYFHLLIQDNFLARKPVPPSELMNFVAILFDEFKITPNQLTFQYLLDGFNKNKYLNEMMTIFTIMTRFSYFDVPLEKLTVYFSSLSAYFYESHSDNHLKMKKLFILIDFLIENQKQNSDFKINNQIFTVLLKSAYSIHFSPSVDASQPKSASKDPLKPDRSKHLFFRNKKLLISKILDNFEHQLDSKADIISLTSVFFALRSINDDKQFFYLRKCLEFPDQEFIRILSSILMNSPAVFTDFIRFLLHSPSTTNLSNKNREFAILFFDICVNKLNLLPGIDSVTLLTNHFILNSQDLLFIDAWKFFDVLPEKSFYLLDKLMLNLLQNAPSSASSDGLRFAFEEEKYFYFVSKFFNDFLPAKNSDKIKFQPATLLKILNFLTNFYFQKTKLPCNETNLFNFLNLKENENLFAFFKANFCSFVPDFVDNSEKLYLFASMFSKFDIFKDFLQPEFYNSLIAKFLTLSSPAAPSKPQPSALAHANSFSQSLPASLLSKENYVNLICKNIQQNNFEVAWKVLKSKLQDPPLADSGNSAFFSLSDESVASLMNHLIRKKNLEAVSFLFSIYFKNGTFPPSSEFLLFVTNSPIELVALTVEKAVASGAPVPSDVKHFLLKNHPKLNQILSVP